MKHDLDTRRLGERLRAELVPRLDAVGQALVADCRARTAVGNPATDPHSGALKASWTYQVDTTQALVRVGTELLHGRFYEIGTEAMAPRAPLRRTLAEDGAAVLSILTKG